MTDNEIMKALECHLGINPKKCSECTYTHYNWTCLDRLQTDLLDLINRIQEENNKLKYQVNRLKNYDERRDIDLHSRLIANARDEAIKEFAERLKEMSYPFPCAIGVEHAVTIRVIDDLVEEMVGDELRATEHIDMEI